MTDIKEKCKSLENKINGTSYFDIMLYNDIVNSDKKIDLSSSLDSLISIYDKLFGFGFSLSGYQFIGLVLEKTIVDNDNKYAPFAYFMLAIGFIISLFGSMSSFFILEFLTSVKNEDPEFIVHSIRKYKRIFKLCAESLLFLDSILFLIPINILIYNVLNDMYGFIFNVISVFLFFSGLIFSYCVIIAKQEFKIDKDEKYITEYNIDDGLIRRRLYYKEKNC